jgi:citrate lyase alpha subunit
MNKLEEKMKEAITFNSWDNGTTISFYKEGVEGDEASC